VTNCNSQKLNEYLNEKAKSSTHNRGSPRGFGEQGHILGINLREHRISLLLKETLTKIRGRLYLLTGNKGETPKSKGNFKGIKGT